jgi:hypothetical protein
MDRGRQGAQPTETATTVGSGIRIVSSPLPARERIKGEGPITARDFFARDSRFRLLSES